MIKLITDHVGFGGLLFMLAADVATTLLLPVVTPEGAAVELILVSLLALLLTVAARAVLRLLSKFQPANSAPPKSGDA